MDRNGSRAARDGADLTGDLFPVREVEQPRTIVLRGREVRYLLKRSARRRRIAFLVDETGLSVQVPWRVGEHLVEEEIHKAARWILAKLEEWSHRAPAPRRAWTDGAALDYLGRSIALAVVHDPVATLVEFKPEGLLEVRSPTPDDPSSATVLPGSR